MKRYRYLYLSPHYDDTALSCGGLAHRQAQAGQAVLSVTVCAAPPSSQHYSAYATAMHQLWGDPGDIIATRQAEDQAAMVVLGLEAAYLNFSDCIYRGDLTAGQWFYNSDAEIFGEIHPGDRALSRQIAAAVEVLPISKAETTLYAPLTVGHHVDHQLAHHAARLLLAQGYRVVFYEEFPYADPDYPYRHRPGESNPYSVAFALAEPHNAGLKPERVELSEANLAAKVDSIRAYASQMTMLFGDAASMAEVVQRYAWQVGEDRPAERLWWP
jgi:LmbE family N-acetylglucosaminyl deacetylase